MSNPVEIAIPTPHLGQKHVLDKASRFTVLACGRRWGKTQLALIRAAIGLSQKQPVAYFSPTHKNLAEMWRGITQVFGPALTNVNKAERRFELIGGGSMEMWSLDHPGTIRGRKYALALIDEAAHVIDLGEAWNAVIRPTLTDLKGQAMFLSTPSGHNYFFELYNRGANLDFPDWTSFHAPSKNNPILDNDEIEAAKLDLPQDIFEQEYEAAFRTAGTAVFRNIRACLNAKPSTPDDHHGHQIIGGIDWGSQNDFTVISLGCRQCRIEVELDRFNQIGWSFQRGRIQSLFDKWNVRESLVEANSIGEPNIEALLRDGLAVQPFWTTAQSKPQLIQNLALCFEREEFQFLDVAEATRELEAFASKQSKETGRWQYSAPGGMHDDTVIARALMYRKLNAGIGVYI